MFRWRSATNRAHDLAWQLIERFGLNSISVNAEKFLSEVVISRENPFVLVLADKSNHRRLFWL